MMGLKKMIVDLTPGPLVRMFASPYVAGRGMDAGLKKAKEIWEQSELHSTIDLLGEEIYDAGEVEAVVNIYLQLVERLEGETFASISMKPTQLGFFQSPDTCLENYRRITAAAAAKNLAVTVDMEDHTFTDITLEHFRALRDEFDNVGTVLQARLFRTREDILALPKKQCRIRICIGIYNEPKTIALQRKPEMKEKLFEFVQLLLDNGHFPEIATHDEPLIRRCLEYMDKRNVPCDAYEIQMLMGVPRQAIQKEIIERGTVCRLYVPFADLWKHALAYMKRRMTANPMMVAFVLKNLFGKATGK